MKKKILTTLSVVLILGMAALGILAYLTSEDSDVNVMTLGNVNIEQYEYDGNGKEVTNGNFGKLYPGVNVVKSVNVENTGKSDAYVRTLVAFETIGGESFGYTPTWYDGEIKEPVTTIAVNGVTYEVYEVIYEQALAKGVTTNFSLVEAKLSEKSTNEDMEALGGTYEILVLSQAVQTEGFDATTEKSSAEVALDTAFGDVTRENAEDWFSTLMFPALVDTADDMREAMKTPGTNLILEDDVVINDDKETGYALYAKYDCTIDLNGHDIVLDYQGKEFYGLVYALKGAKVDIVGDGDIVIEGGVGNWVWATGAAGATEVNIYGGNWIENSDDFSSDLSEDKYCEGIYANREGVINIYGGTFQWDTVPEFTVNESREGVINIYGGTFINFDPRVSHDSDGSYVAEGYKVVAETQENGDIWYTVVPE